MFSVSAMASSEDRLFEIAETPQIEVKPALWTLRGISVARPSSSPGACEEHGSGCSNGSKSKRRLRLAVACAILAVVLELHLAGLYQAAFVVMMCLVFACLIISQNVHDKGDEL